MTYFLLLLVVALAAGGAYFLVLHAVCLADEVSPRAGAVLAGGLVALAVSAAAVFLPLPGAEVLAASMFGLGAVLASERVAAVRKVRYERLFTQRIKARGSEDLSLHLIRKST